MNILVLQGPNLNLIGLRSSKIGEHITLDKINSSLASNARSSSANIKILQTAKVSRALSFLHRNRNWAQAILIAPMGWAPYEYSILEALNLIQIPYIEIVLDKPYSSVTETSIFSDCCIKTEIGHPESVFISAFESILKHLNK